MKATEAVLRPEYSLDSDNDDHKLLSRENYQKTIVDYYSQVGMDYEPWSQNFNMHFGYFRFGLNPFKRESLLNEMNYQVCQRLNIENKKDIKQAPIIDLGCGVGATARYCVQNYERAAVKGVTIVPWQIKQAYKMSTRLDKERTHYELADYSNLPYGDQSFSGAYAVESSCYDKGSDKIAFLREAYRVLQPGSNLVVADGFRKTKRANPVFEFSYRQVCKGWSLETFANIDDFTEAMYSVGFKNIVVEDISWRIAPSVLHVPWVSIKYLFTHLFSKKGSKKFQALHFIAPMMGLVVGLHRKHYGYYLVTANK